MHAGEAVKVAESAVGRLSGGQLAQGAAAAAVAREVGVPLPPLVAPQSPRHASCPERGGSCAGGMGEAAHRPLERGR
jgi:hypothetical protein